MAGFEHFQEKLKHWLRSALSCCRDNEDQEAEWKPVIGGPFDFRREDVCIAGLSPSEQDHLRAQAVSDADGMFASLEPFDPPAGSSPSSPTAQLQSRSQCQGPQPRLDRVRAHTRALSNSLLVTPRNGGFPSLSTLQNSPVASESATVSSATLLGHGGCGGAHDDDHDGAGSSSLYEMRQLMSHGLGGGSSHGGVPSEASGSIKGKG